VQAYLRGAGLDVIQTTANRLTITVRGARAQVEDAFHVPIADYRYKSRTFYANTANPRLPAAVAPFILAVVGLSNLAVPRPAVVSAPAGSALTPQSLARAYDFGPQGATGMGQTVGLIEFSDFDVVDVQHQLATVGLPASYATPPHLSVVDVDPKAPVPENGDQSEALIDIATVIGMAPGANVVVFESLPTDSSGLPIAADFQQILNKMLNNPVPINTISISFITCESENTRRDLQSLDSVMAQAAAAGVSVFSASGDAGPICSDTGDAEVAMPAGVPDGTAVGGTTLSVDSAGSYATESWWPSGGYGTSHVFQGAPFYQPQGSGRSVPDVSADADPASGFLYCEQDLAAPDDPSDPHGYGCTQLAGGTSMAAPIWAAATALMNERCGGPAGLVAAWVSTVPSGLHPAAGMTAPDNDFPHLGFGSFDLARLIAGACPQGTGRAMPDSPALLAAGADPQDWPMYGHDYTNDRYSSLTQIDTANVSTLVPRWIYHTAVFAPFEATPAVYNGVMYVTAAYDKVFALDAATGRLIWQYDPKVSTASLCCGPVNRGVALAYGTVYLATLDARLIVLDAATGQLKWERHIVAPPATGYSETMAPAVYKNMVIVGISGAEYGIRGFVAAYDALTGRSLWRWYTVSAGWEGNWATTTPEGDSLHRDIEAEKTADPAYPDAWQHGGGSMWMTPAFDPALNLIYVGTGNPSPDLDGSARPGDNLYTDSIVALHAADGTLAWYYQEVPHDIWGLDQASPPLLFGLTIKGRPVPAVGAAGKTGWFYVLDGRTGARILRSTPFVSQKNLFAPPTAAGVPMLPGSNGGAEWSPTSYSPATRDVYVAGLVQPMIYSTHPAPRTPGQQWLGSSFVPVPGAPQSGTFTAINVDTGKIAWQRTVPQSMVGGSLATAGGLVFTGEADGHFDAFDAATGQMLLHYLVGTGVNAAPMAFEVNGREYIAVAAGGSSEFGPPYGDALTVFSLP
jgi:alcohol dehydrogenase (cytochrome c)